MYWVIKKKSGYLEVEKTFFSLQEVDPRCLGHPACILHTSGYNYRPQSSQCVHDTYRLLNAGRQMIFRNPKQIKQSRCLDDWLTVHRSITLADFQLDAQNSYLFIYNTFIKILYTFRALPCSSSGGLRRNRIYAVSGIVTLCR
jgi:hypothetical protein